MDRYHYHTRAGCGAGGKSTGGAASPLEGPELLLGWGKRKRVRCVKFSRKKSAVAVASAAVIGQKVMATPMDRQAVQSEKEQAAPGSRRNSSASHRVLRNLDGNGGTRGGERSSPPEAVNGGGGPWGSSEKGGSSSGSEGAAWPRIEIALTTQEKEEDFMAFKGTKPSLRPKKRAKPIQKNVNLMSPGTWLCDLSLERYEVREKKTSKKQRPRGLRAMGSKDSDSE
ncbi:uncharacterized protein LOC110113892 isoform X1 [Dendrobium catenatum]|uniref:uncharacterized protein LOC110113892 isoform X1 n=1 Tax=Dendrobium catenatum TaxID=906689 RepID=UPI0009F2620E|nr:uncharacterized protein LOC110113892 isoform X1 [Dendrobium catenatum]XP_028549609.1 uncharacterized protein LOC110113892 isoform X1 [Dendrobium catenatum]